MSIRGLLSEMRALDPLPQGAAEPGAPAIEVSLLIPARNSAHALEGTVSEAHRFFSRRCPGRFEIILIPNPGPEGARSGDRSPELASELASRHPEVRCAPHTGVSGKGAALRTGFASSRGRWVLFTDADLPYDLEFFDRALEKLASGYGLVTGNRRLPESQFDLPVELLRLAYGRHRLGLAFNRVVRLLLPIRTTDTQAGIKAMSRELASRAFGTLSCPGFFFDLEVFLTAAGAGMRHAELPVTLRLNTEKSTVRVLRQSVLAAFWLARIWLGRLAHHYGRPRKPADVLGRYRPDSLSTRAFLTARWKLTPYRAMAAQLPPRGRILDLGCGHGLLALAIALEAPERQVVGTDHDEARIALARSAAEGVPNASFGRGGLFEPPAGPWDGITMIDVMHYFAPERQQALFAQAFQLLAPGGTLLVREVDPEDGLVSKWNRLYEKLATTTGFTRAQKEGLHFRAREDWEEALREAGFEVRSERCSSALFADILYVCRKPGAASGKGSA